MAFFAVLATILAALLTFRTAEAQATTGFNSCDALIAAGLGDRVYVSTDAAYEETINTFWSGTVQALRPWCVLKPLSTEEVSRAIVALGKVSPAGNWDIAIRSGGHTSWPSNNVARGVTIDLGYMNSTVVKDENGGIASIGSGARWGSVFGELEKYGKAVTGGREGNVGVGGLLLGGGASFFSSKRGFACDEVVNYEVVLADGTIVQANAEENPDLFKALKGGTNNFGVVTRFDMRAFDQGDLYGGLLFYTYDKKDVVFSQFVRLIDINAENPSDTEVFSLIYTSPGPAPMIALSAINTDGQANSTSFDPLVGVEALIDDRGLKSYQTIITQYTSPGGPRTVWFSFCFQNRVDIINYIADEYTNLISEIETLVPGSNFSLTFVFQPLPKQYVKEDANNVLGLDKSLVNNSIIFLIWASTDTLEIESLFSTKLAIFVAKIEAYIESQGASTAWKYLNYVNPTQDPISTYGADNVAFLKHVAARYDPSGFFQHRVPGGFKISRVWG